MSAALAALLAVYASDAFVGGGDLPVVGYVGRDTPVELLTAAGTNPLRLRAPLGADQARADELLGLGVDPAIRGILAGLLGNAFGRLDAIVVSSDCDASQRLFYILRELRRREDAAGLPPLMLIDLLHSPGDAVARYNAARLQQLVPFVEEVGRPITPDALTQAVDDHTVVRALLRDVLALRRESPARLSGSDALSILGATTRLPAAAAATHLRALRAERDQLPSRSGRRLYLSGSSHDSTAVYRELERDGATVVGEDHEWGEIAAERDPAGATLDALAIAYRDNGPSAQRASITARAEYAAMGMQRAHADTLVTYAREKDDAPLWDAGAIVAASGLPALSLSEQRFREIDADSVANRLTEVHA